MARFRGSVRGQRGTETRLGSEKSGLAVCADGWNFGVSVSLRVRDGEDVADIYLTGGSNGGASPKRLGTFTVKDL